MSLKALKVQDISRKRRVGVAVSSFDELRVKSCDKLDIKFLSDHISVCLEEDGTLVDASYFPHLKPNTLLVILTKGQTYRGREGEVCDALDRLWKCSKKKVVAEILHSFMMEEREEKYELMMALIEEMGEEQSRLENREQDGKWFEGLEKRFKTKDSVMRESARRRIRQYLYNSKEQLSQAASPSLTHIFSMFQTSLKKNDYNSHYFSRHTHLSSYCDHTGKFTCQGSYANTNCSSYHSINPYVNKESRILFSTWNLDHIVERSREVLPSLIRAVTEVERSRGGGGGSGDDRGDGREDNVDGGVCGRRKRRENMGVNWCYFYELLFTQANLKLVHIVCHKKDAHVGYVCDETRFYL